MPYKRKKDRVKYQQKYHQFRTKKLQDVKKAIDNGDIPRAKRILGRKPNITVRPRTRRRKK